MQKLSKGSVDADRRIMAKSRVAQKITSIEPCPDGSFKLFERSMFNDRQWHSLFVYCWQHKEDFEFEYSAGSKADPRALSTAQMAKMGIEIEDDDSIVMKHKTYTEDELKAERIKSLRAICVAKEVPDDGDKRTMIDAILEAQRILED